MKLKIKRYILLFVCIVAFGISLGIMKGMLNIPDDIFWKVYYIFGAFVIIGCITFNHCYHRYYGNKMKEAIKILETGEPDEYINYINQLLQKAKGRYLKTLFTVNLSVGYTDKKEYKKAIELLESVSNNRMYGVLKMVYRLNLCCNYYYNGQGEKAKAIYQESLKIFKPFRETPMYGGNIAVIDIFMELDNENFDLAEALLMIAKSKWNNPRLQEDYLFIEETLKENDKSSKLIYEEFSKSKQHKFEIFLTKMNTYDIWLCQFDDERKEYFSIIDDRHIVDTLENAKMVGRGLLAQRENL